MQSCPQATLIAGNTSIGVYKDGDALIDATSSSSSIFVSLQDVNELHGHAITKDGSLGK